MTSCLVPLALGVSQLSGLAIVALLFGVGAGLGVASVPLQLAAIEAVDVSESGLVAGIFSTSCYLGSITGISLFAGALAPAATGTGGSDLSSQWWPRRPRALPRCPSYSPAGRESSEPWTPKRPVRIGPCQEPLSTLCGASDSLRT